MSSSTTANATSPPSGGDDGVFNHLDTGSDESAWARHPLLKDAPQLGIPGQGEHLIVVAAHPDDETLGAGGLIAAAGARGARIDIIVATDGEASHPASPTHSPERLAALRRAEVRGAVARLAPTATMVHLGLPDGQLDQHHAALVAAIKHHITAGAVLVTPWRGDRHPDHEACGRAARSLLRRQNDCQHWQYPIWAWHWADADSDTLPWTTSSRVDIDADAHSAKQAALACYASQHHPLSTLAGDETVLSEAFLAHFRRTYETFVVEPVHPAGDPSYFDDLYADTDDPWGLETRFYEQRKRDLLISVLPKPRFSRAFEPGCSTGLLTEALARRCDEVVACDAAARPVAVAVERTAYLNNVSVTRRAVPAEWPDGKFDLIVLSEIGYYCDDLTRLGGAVRNSLARPGVVVACHWRHPAADHPHSAAAVHDMLGTGLERIVQHIEDDFLLDVWSTTGDSVARHTGVIQ
jgi:LmbE family N-acetylglucosaminyl deacetylase/SAM-dependent methyltransferase